MKYLTQILGKRVLGPDEGPIGTVIDVVATLGARLPVVSAIIVRVGKLEVCLPYSAIEFDPDAAGPLGTGRIVGDIRLLRPLAEIVPVQPGDTDMRLNTDVLDKQVVDVGDYRVVRVNDVRLVESAGQYCVVGVDSSFRALLRRLGGISVPIEAFARAIHRPLRSNLIGWDDVQTLEPGTAGGRIQLKVSHDKIARLHPADIADIVEQLNPQQRTEVIVALDTETAADAIANANPEIATQIMDQLDDETATDIVAQLEPDEAADLLNDLSDTRRDELLEKMSPGEAEDVKELMAYDDDTAGGLMTTELVAIAANLTCEETINRLRELAPRAETIYYVYVVDPEDRLVGVLSLRDLVIAPPETHIADIMVRNVIHVYDEDHADAVAQTIGRYNLLAVPVVNEEEKLMGIITVDDTLERLLPPERRRRLPTPALTDQTD